MTQKKYHRQSPWFKLHALKRAGEVAVTEEYNCKEDDMSRRQRRLWRDRYGLMGDEAYPRHAVARDEGVVEHRNGRTPEPRYALSLATK